MPSSESTKCTLNLRILVQQRLFSKMVAVAVCCILVFLAVFIVIIIVVGQSVGDQHPED